MYNSISIYGNPFITGFSPPQIPNLELWLDASDVSTVTIGGGLPANTVTAWMDKSINGNDQTSYLIGGTSGPIYSLASSGDGINMLNAIQTNSYFFGNMLSELITSTQGSIFVSLKFTAIPRSSGSVDTGDAILGTANDMGVYVDDTFNIYDFNRSGGAPASLSQSGSVGLSNTMCWIHGSGNLRGAVDLSPLLTIASGATDNPNKDFTIGATLPGTGLDPTNNFQGRIGEILVFSRELNAAEISLVRSYLAGKWLETLPPDAYLEFPSGETYLSPDFKIYRKF